MLIEKIETTLVKFLSLGAFFVTIFVWTATGTDPVNVTKLWISGGIAVGSAAIAIRFAWLEIWVNSKWLFSIAGIFVLAMINSVVQSKAPLSQTFYGSYGRSTGLLTYLMLTLILLAASTIRGRASFKFVVNSLLAAGIVNVLYCGWVLLFGDFIPWNNQYNSILGTLGNPDFISAFLGLFITVILSRIPDPHYSASKKILGIGLAGAAFLEIVKSHAIQGVVVTAGGALIVCLFYIRARFSRNWPQIIFLILSSIFGFLAIMGTLQKGPLSFVYKKSVSLRGTYWRTGVEMGKSHPFSGVGMDSYGDWYKRLRPPVALVDTPPISVVSNVAHNVVIDFFASGGWPLLISYLGIISIGIYSIIKVARRQKAYDASFVGLAALWLCYEVQSFISINQIGLAIWGWLATGLLFAYSRTNSDIDSKQISKKQKKVYKSGDFVSANLIGGVGVLIGLLIAFPALNSDLQWRNALNSKNLQVLEKSLVPSFFNPSSCNRYSQAIVTLRNSNLNDLALKYTLEAVRFNPDYSDFWKLMYSNPVASVSQKALALENAKRLDPKNPNPLA